MQVKCTVEYCHIMLKITFLLIRIKYSVVARDRQTTKCEETINVKVDGKHVDVNQE